MPQDPAELWGTDRGKTEADMRETQTLLVRRCECLDALALFERQIKEIEWSKERVTGHLREIDNRIARLNHVRPGSSAGIRMPGWYSLDIQVSMPRVRITTNPEYHSPLNYEAEEAD